MQITRDSQYLRVPFEEGRYLRHTVQHHFHLQSMTFGLFPCLVATKGRPYVQVSVVLVPYFRDIRSISDRENRGALRFTNPVRTSRPISKPSMRVSDRSATPWTSATVPVASLPSAPVSRAPVSLCNEFLLFTYTNFFLIKKLFFVEIFFVVFREKLNLKIKNFFLPI